LNSSILLAELFVRDVQQILLNIEGRETITVEQNKVLMIE